MTETGDRSNQAQWRLMETKGVLVWTDTQIVVTSIGTLSGSSIIIIKAVKR